MASVLVNPRPALIGTQNAIVSGVRRQYDMRGFRAPCSIKSVIRGAAQWETAAGMFEVTPGSALILNDDEEYALTVDSLRPVETFCLFFAEGFVGDACHSATTGSARLLDCTGSERPTPLLAEPLRFDPTLLQLLRATYSNWKGGADVEPDFIRVASFLALTALDYQSRVSRLPALRAATRSELARRLNTAVAFIHGSLASPLPLNRVARQASLSPFHFHRLMNR